MIKSLLLSLALFYSVKTVAMLVGDVVYSSRTLKRTPNRALLLGVACVLWGLYHYA